MTVTRQGEAVVVLPMRAPERAAALLVARHGAWLDRQVARIQSRDAELASRPALAVGRVVDVGGRPRSLVARDAGERTRLERGLRDEARAVLEARVAALAPVIGVQPGRVTIRAQRARWGSASRSGSLSFNWRLILAPAHVLDYVVVHELVHLARPGHTRGFWSTVRRHAPRTDEARRWLREHHHELMAVLD